MESSYVSDRYIMIFERLPKLLKEVNFYLLVTVGYPLLYIVMVLMTPEIFLFFILILAHTNRNLQPWEKMK